MSDAYLIFVWSHRGYRHNVSFDLRIQSVQGPRSALHTEFTNVSYVCYDRNVLSGERFGGYLYIFAGIAQYGSKNAE